MANLSKSRTNAEAAIPTVSLLRRKGLSNPIPPLGPPGSRENYVLSPKLIKGALKPVYLVTKILWYMAFVLDWLNWAHVYDALDWTSLVKYDLEFF